MGYEVEIKYRLVDHGQLIERLAQRGAAQEPALTQEDVYLSHPARNFATTKEALRIRRIQAENRVTYKGPRHTGPTKTREEIEISFASGDDAFAQLLRLFGNLGFQPVATVRKSRTTFHLTWHGRKIEVAFDRVADLGDFAEIETLATSETELPAAQGAVLALADELALTEVEARSYLRMSLDSRSLHGDSAAVPEA
jgi:adenylate cyclase class 2